jgi:hypothetical protein
MAPTWDNLAKADMEALVQTSNTLNEAAANLLATLAEVLDSSELGNDLIQIRLKPAISAASTSRARGFFRLLGTWIPTSTLKKNPAKRPSPAASHRTC